jgi:hypothetical protein
MKGAVLSPTGSGISLETVGLHRVRLCHDVVHVAAIILCYSGAVHMESIMPDMVEADKRSGID